MSIKLKKILEKKKKKKLVCLTAYSKNIAKILDKYCDISFSRRFTGKCFIWYEKYSQSFIKYYNSTQYKCKKRNKKIIISC